MDDEKLARLLGELMREAYQERIITETRGEDARETATAVDVRLEHNLIRILLDDGRELNLPLERIKHAQELATAS